MRAHAAPARWSQTPGPWELLPTGEETAKVRAPGPPSALGKPTPAPAILTSPPSHRTAQSLPAARSTPWGTSQAPWPRRSCRHTRDVRARSHHGHPAHTTTPRPWVTMATLHTPPGPGVDMATLHHTLSVQHLRKHMMPGSRQTLLTSVPAEAVSTRDYSGPIPALSTCRHPCSPSLLSLPG